MNAARPLMPLTPAFATTAGHPELERTDRSHIARIGRRTSRSWTRALLAAFALAGLVVGTGATAYAQTGPGRQCAIAKQNAALKRLRAINACYRAPSQLGQQQPTPSCLTNADLRFQRDFMRIEADDICIPATGDADGVAHLVDQCALGLVVALPGMCQDAGSVCGGTNPPCCAGLMCIGQIGQSPRCS